MKIRIYISQEVMETLGDGSLVGMLMHELEKVESRLDHTIEVELVFKQSSIEYRRKNGGPDHWIMPEFSVMCLVDGILWLNEQGIRVTVQEEVISANEE